MWAERMRIRGRETAAAVSGGEESAQWQRARLVLAGGGHLGRPPVSVLQSVLPGATPSASAERPTPTSFRVISVCDPRRLRVWIYQKVTPLSAAAPRHLHVNR